MSEAFTAHLDEGERLAWEGLDSPRAIQDFLDSTQYSAEDANRSVLRVLRDRQAHCLDGGLFAVAALRRLGHPPLLVDMLPEPGTDDDHVLAIFRQHGRYGAVAKSNFSGLRYREPVYHSLRELVMSYFEFYFNKAGQRTLRGYTRPVHLARFDRLNWMTESSGVDAIEKHLYGLKSLALFPEAAIAGLTPVDRLTYQAGMLGVNEAGLYKPKAPQP
jgi:hypothetical protein